MAEIERRLYQLDAVQRAREAYRQGARRILLAAPTGSGKTLIGTDIVRLANQKYHHVLWVAHRRELIHQAAEKLEWAGIPYGILMAGSRGSMMARVQVCSIQTLHSRIIRGKDTPPHASIIVIDEAHHSIAKTYQSIISLYPNAMVLGLTATPCRGDGRGLGGMFDSLIEVISIRDLIAQGYLVPTRVFAPEVPDLKGVTVRRGDYDERQLEERMDRPDLIGNLVRDWRLYGQGRPTLVFASGVKHSMHIRDQLRFAGASVEHVDGDTRKADRDQMFEALRAGELDAITNCNVATEGVDVPRVGCTVLARPTKSYGLYLQMAGRTLRPFPGKEDAVLIDHAGAVYQHGFVEDAGAWTLDPQVSSHAEAKKRQGEKPPTTCRNCFHVYEGRRRCPMCGWQPSRQAEVLDMQEGRLKEVKGAKRKKEWTAAEKAHWYGMFLQVAIDKGYRVGWAAHKFKLKFGTWPRNQDSVQPLPPTEEFRRFMTHINMRYALGKAKAKRAFG